MSAKQILDVAVTAAVGVMAVTLVVTTLTKSDAQSPGPQNSLPNDLVDTGANVSGQPTAPVGVVVFSDFECGYCGRFARETLPLLTQKYVQGGAVLAAFRHFPSQRNHRYAVAAATAATCAGEQGAFWQMHDAMFAQGALLDPPSLKAYVADLGLEGGRFDECTNGDARKVVEQDLADGIALGVAATPTIFVGTRTSDGRVKALSSIRGAQPADVFVRAIEEALTAARRN